MEHVKQSTVRKPERASEHPWQEIAEFLGLWVDRIHGHHCVIFPPIMLPSTKQDVHPILVSKDGVKWILGIHRSPSSWVSKAELKDGETLINQINHAYQFLDLDASSRRLVLSFVSASGL
jgi:hypothetical protein